ncbi:MAG: hypothetical protein ABIZ05_14700 [Pseudonocardiaceae bacterium]
MIRVPLAGAEVYEWVALRRVRVGGDDRYEWLCQQVLLLPGGQFIDLCRRFVDENLDPVIRGTALSD